MAMLAGLSLFSIAGCSSLNLGDVDESVDDREEMSGPGIFGDALTIYTSNSNKTDSAKTTSKKAVNSNSVKEPLSEKQEFELYKEWLKVRSDDASDEEFKTWLKFKQLK